MCIQIDATDLNYSVEKVAEWLGVECEYLHELVTQLDGPAKDRSDVSLRTAILVSVAELLSRVGLEHHTTIAIARKLREQLETAETLAPSVSLLDNDRVLILDKVYRLVDMQEVSEADAITVCGILLPGLEKKLKTLNYV